ncbi:hypothetical protein BwSH20_72560 [Bradyrhizobium ottawaense]|uniref:Uncharacterized protein n=1 Tax=Bradyrhizobium diazoefficiens TaxID=1355477 RepID=A0A810B8I0_9BRAD|nr:hypothetical protein SG09_73830 [Bradyrhizobium ottawaense]BCA01585.1 hypothetical protein H12S4_24890 [Bradyrhizobium diazoefficiens]GEC50174.1 hypothetical protein BJA01nite_78160 [Bradyrhizobium japonicum]BCA10211.1 hypothetical protein BDHF08_20580 [Bradyrhizobium diazoefficiens]BCA18953.1 hypothetical protein BDHH15_21680 [Bradyrhizobium diazoefficiens]
MVRNLMPFRNHSSDEFRMLRRVRPDDEECRGDPMLRQDIEHLWRTKWIWPIVKGQMDSSTSARVSVVAADSR